MSLGEFGGLSALAYDDHVGASLHSNHGLDKFAVLLFDGDFADSGRSKMATRRFENHLAFFAGETVLRLFEGDEFAAARCILKIT